jgi:restriction endonuclease S subunit
MQKKLSEIASISSGYAFRGSIDDNPKGNILVLQAKNISTNQDVVDTSELVTISDKTLRAPYFVSRNDILLVSRGAGAGSFRAATFTSETSNVMPSSSLHIIRIKDVTVLPKYLCLYLNSNEGQKELSQIVTGATIQSILVSNLQNLQIPAPSVQTQKLIIALHENIFLQERILKRKQEIQKVLANSTFTNTVI